MDINLFLWRASEREKNKIDNKIIRDAKKILNENKCIDIFVIVSRDGDFTELVKFLRTNHKRVVRGKKIRKQKVGKMPKTRRFKKGKNHDKNTLYLPRQDANKTLKSSQNQGFMGNIIEIYPDFTTFDNYAIAQ